MKRFYLHKYILGNDDGAVAPLVGILMFLFIAFAALAIDVGHLYGVRNELQNAADGAALAAALVMRDPTDGTLNLDEAIDEGTGAANLHKSGKDKITEVVVEVGHWCFSCATDGGKLGKFTMPGIIDEDAPILLGKSDADLDTDEEFINAVRVTTRRSQTPSFFAKIFGIADLFLRTNAVAYLGFTGDLQPGEADQPVGICMQDIIGWGTTNAYQCNTGRMLNNNSQSAGWLDLDQPAPNECSGSANTPTINDDICAGNNQPVVFGIDINATNGTNSTTYLALQDCWRGQPDLISASAKNILKDKTNNIVSAPDNPWKVLLPVIDCASGKPDGCTKVVGAVEIEVLWITVNNPEYYPVKMGEWECNVAVNPNTDPLCWTQFVDHFELQDEEDVAAGFVDKSMYFKPTCNPEAVRGNTGGSNFGVIAKIPKLVNPHYFQ